MYKLNLNQTHKTITPIEVRMDAHCSQNAQAMYDWVGINCQTLNSIRMELDPWSIDYQTGVGPKLVFQFLDQTEAVHFAKHFQHNNDRS